MYYKDVFNYARFFPYTFKHKKEENTRPEGVPLQILITFRAA